MIILWQKEYMTCLIGGICTWLSGDGGLRQEHGRGQLRGWRWHGGRAHGPGVAETAAVLGLVEKTKIELGTGIERDVRVKFVGRRSTSEVRTQGLVDLKDVHVEPSSRRRTWSRTRRSRRSAGTGSKTYGVGAPPPLTCILIADFCIISRCLSHPDGNPLSLFGFLLKATLSSDPVERVLELFLFRSTNEYRETVFIGSTHSLRVWCIALSACRRIRFLV